MRQRSDITYTKDSSKFWMHMWRDGIFEMFTGKVIVLSIENIHLFVTSSPGFTYAEFVEVYVPVLKDFDVNRNMAPSKRGLEIKMSCLA